MFLVNEVWLLTDLMFSEFGAAGLCRTHSPALIVSVFMGCFMSRQQLILSISGRQVTNRLVGLR